MRSMRHERAVRPAMPMGAAWAVAGMGYGRYMGGYWWEVRRRVEEVRLGREGWMGYKYIIRWGFGSW